MAGLDPAIHVLFGAARQERRGCPWQARAWRKSCQSPCISFRRSGACSYLVYHPAL